MFTHVRTLEPVMIADLDTLLTALYVELTDRIIPERGFTRRGPGSWPEVTDAELACIAVAQVLLRFDDERHWLRIAPKLIGHLFPQLLRQSEYNARLKNLAPLMGAALRWLAEATPGSTELLRLMDATPIACGHPVITAKRSGLYGWAGYGYCPSHSRWYWGSKLLLMCTCDGTVTGFGLANPKLYGEREQARQMLEQQPANRPAPGTAVVTDKGLAGEETEAFFAGDHLCLTLIRPARKDEKEPRYFPNWLRQRVEAIIWTLKNQLGLERHGGRVPAGLWARVIQRLLALNACIWRDWLIGAPVKRSLIAHDHKALTRFPVNDLGRRPPPIRSPGPPRGARQPSGSRRCRHASARPDAADPSPPRAAPVPVAPAVGARRALVVEGDAAIGPGHPSPSGSMHRWFPAAVNRASD